MAENAEKQRRSARLRVGLRTQVSASSPTLPMAGPIVHQQIQAANVRQQNQAASSNVPQQSGDASSSVPQQSEAVLTSCVVCGKVPCVCPARVKDLSSRPNARVQPENFCWLRFRIHEDGTPLVGCDIRQKFSAGTLLHSGTTGDPNISPTKSHTARNCDRLCGGGVVRASTVSLSNEPEQLNKITPTTDEL